MFQNTLTYGFSTGVPLNILIIYGKDPNFKKLVTL